MYTEQRLLINDENMGLLTTAEAADSPPVVLMLHGFGNHKDEVGDLYKRLATALAELGIASFRFDFRGWGESTGEMAATTIDGQVEDTRTVYASLTTFLRGDAARVGVLGFSLGSISAMLTAPEARYAAMVLWSPVAHPKEDAVAGFGEETIQRAAREERITLDLGWRSVTLRHAFFESLERAEPLEAIRSYSGPLLAIAGSTDSSARDAQELVAAAGSTDKEARIFEGADHIFGALDDDQSTSERLIKETAGWFARTLATGAAGTDRAQLPEGSPQ